MQETAKKGENKVKKSLIAAVLMLSVAALANAALNPANTVKGSSHDLSVDGALDASGQVCVFCHTPHNASSDINQPLWSHQATQNANFKLYDNTDFGTITIGQPGSISKACLGCHDGSIALGYVANGAFASDGTAANNLANGAHGARDAAGLTIAIGDAMNIGGGSDGLSRTHPIGLTYPTAGNTKFNAVDMASATAVKLFKEGGSAKDQIECASCHEPHNQGEGATAATRYFLRSSNATSALCLTCHIK
jgi:Doubled CXXCH motif (Paired_CXXCH_1)